MNDVQTSLLATRLHSLADVLTPDLDVTTQARAARSRYRRQRRGRLAVLATVAATIAVVGVPTAIGALSQAPHGQTARPGISTPTVSPATPDQSTAEERAKAAAEERLRAAVTAAEGRVTSGVTPAVDSGHAATADQSLAEERLKAAQSMAARQRPGG